MKINYLKRIKLILSQVCTDMDWQGWFQECEKNGIEYEVIQESSMNKKEEGTLYITDSTEVLVPLKREGLPVLVYNHGAVTDMDFSEARYVLEGPEAPDAEYLERVYRRFAKIPWDILETERCLVRESTPDDVKAFEAIYGEPSVTRYMEPFVTEAGGEGEYLRKYIDEVYAYYEFGIWTVVLKETDEVIGRAGISMDDGGDLPRLGYVIGVPWQGRGIATEVCEAILAYANTVLEIDAIQARIHSENRASLHVAKRLGFRKQRTNDFVDGEYHIFVKDA